MAGGRVVQLDGPRPGCPDACRPQLLAQAGGLRQAPGRRSKGHLTAADREEISRGIATGESARRIACRLGRSPSTISRETTRNGGREYYRATVADREARQRARRPKRAMLALLPGLWAVIEEKLALSGSPEQVSGWLRRPSPDDAVRISHDAICLTLYDPRRRQAINRKLTQRLRTALPTRQPRAVRRPSGRDIIRDVVSIGRRPAEVEDRTVPGHREGDLVMGSQPSASAIATLVERTSRFTTLVALPDGIKAEQVTPRT
ncbi:MULTISPECIES: IS30 family transposase [Streptomyces]|uniref:IS30 family transposase n=1 Tax=Streptomyces ehimensis TaxID=68195 RepID=A0ABV9BUI8_9ACTN